MATASARGWPINPATVRVPCPGIPLNLHPAVAPLFAALIARIDAIKGPGFMQSSGGKNVRPVRGYEDRYAQTKSVELLSNHSWALAADFRAATNPMSTRLITDMPANTSAIAASCGLQWGGDYAGRKDPMHFEFMGTPAQAAAAVAALNPDTGRLFKTLNPQEEQEVLRAARAINRAIDTQLPSKVDGTKLWLTDFVLWNNKILTDIAKKLGV